MGTLRDLADAAMVVENAVEGVGDISLRFPTSVQRRDLLARLKRVKLNPSWQCAVERRSLSAGANPAQQLSLRLVAARAVHGGDDMG